jgi:hypothetical protein
MKDLTKYPYEELAHAIYVKGEADGYSKITDKTGWREYVVAEKLGHIKHKKISAGVGKLEYGSDAKDKEDMYAEYKSKAIVESNLKNLFEQTRNKKTGSLFAALEIPGIYNGAYTKEAIDAYSKIDHYFGVFYKELCVLIIKVDTKYVIKTLRQGLLKMTEGKTKNLNTVKVNLGDTHLYDVVYKNEDWWKQND